MPKETLSTHEMLEAKIGEKGKRELGTVARCLVNKEKLSLRIKDQTLIEPTLERIKQIVARLEQEAGIKDTTNFVIIDFRKKKASAWLEDLKKLLGDVMIYHDTYLFDQGLEEDNQRAHAHRKKDRLILINPLAVEDYISNMNEAREEDEALNRINLYVKYGMSTLTILPDKPVRLPYLVSELVGEYSDFSYFLDYDPYKKD